MDRESRSGPRRLFILTGGLVGVVLFGALAFVLIVLFTSYGAPTPTASQPPRSNPQRLIAATPLPLNKREPTMYELYKQKGDLLAQGTNTNPVGNYRLTTYRVEALTLAQPMTITSDQRTQEVSKAWRITIQGGPFRVGDLGYVIWIDDTPLGFAQENRDLSEVSAIIFDPSVLRDGATIAVSYGENRNWRTALPEKLKLPGAR